jgi:predicted permease
LAASDDATPGEGRVAVLSHRHWQDAYGAASDALGSVLRVNGEPLTVVGVAPPGFEGTTPGFRADVFVPLALAGLLQPQMASDFEDRRSYWVYAFGRLAPGATREDAEAALNLPYARLLEDIEVPLNTDLDAQRLAEFKAKRLVLSDGARGQSRTAQQAARPLALLSAVAALVLLIACLNIANLLLARGAARAGEFALRASIGASRGRLVRQLLLESALLAVLGGLASLPLAALLASGLVAWMPAGTLDGFDVRLDGAALRFAALVSLGTVLLFGLFPALQLGRSQPIAALRGESGQSASRGGNRFRASLAITQVALSMASLALAGLFAKSLLNLAAEDLGMQVERMVVFSVSAERQGYDAERPARCSSASRRGWPACRA